jgi:putative iron-dependent peroxidase
MSGRVPIESQRVDAPLTSSATFLVLSITNRPDAIRTIRSTLAGIDGLAKNVAVRDLGASFACTVGIGSDVWDRLTGLPRPSELHPFPAVKGAVRKFVKFVNLESQIIQCALKKK